MPLPDELTLNLVKTTDDLSAFIEWLGRERRFLGFDTETSGLSPERDVIRLIQFGDKTTGWAMSWRDWRGPALEIFDRYAGEFTAHNSKFDVRMICNDAGRPTESWPWHRTHDAMGLAHIWDSQRPKGLKPLGDRLVDSRISQAQTSLHEGMSRHGWNWSTVPVDFPPYWQYGALDPVVTVHITELLIDNVPKGLYDLEMGSTRVAAKMEQIGMQIDPEYCVSKTDELMAYATAARAWLKQVWGIENPTPIQLVKFFNAHGVPLIDKKTNSGAQSMDKHVLQTTDHDVARAVLGIRKAEKRVTYLENFIKYADSDGLLHPSINTMAARTGRMSITEPALQTLPKRDPIVRDAFIPREGHSILTIDADQIEARLTAHFSEDNRLIEAFHSDEDFFCVVASNIYGHEVTKGMIERDLTKGVTYGKIYGASVPTMAASAGVPIADMSKTNALFDTTYPRVHEFMNDVINEGKRRAREADDGRGFVVTPYGRKLKSDRGREYTLVNYLIQCHASEILKKKIVELDAAMPSEALIVLPVHDEIIFDVPTDIVEDVRDEALRVLNDMTNYKVPITWGADVMPAGEAWGYKYRKK